jgi:hypothetical protein
MFRSDLIVGYGFESIESDTYISVFHVSIFLALLHHQRASIDLTVTSRSGALTKLIL